MKRKVINLKKAKFSLILIAFMMYMTGCCKNDNEINNQYQENIQILKMKNEKLDLENEQLQNYKTDLQNQNNEINVLSESTHEIFPVLDVKYELSDLLNENIEYKEIGEEYVSSRGTICRRITLSSDPQQAGILDLTLGKYIVEPGKYKYISNEFQGLNGDWYITVSNEWFSGKYVGTWLKEGLINITTGEIIIPEGKYKGFGEEFVFEDKICREVASYFDLIYANGLVDVETGKIIVSPDTYTSLIFNDETDEYVYTGIREDGSCDFLLKREVLKKIK